MPYLSRYLLSLVCLLAASGPVAAAPSQPWADLAHAAFRHHHDPVLADGAALAQDQTGFIWLGTRHGLVRWDGVRQRRYLANPGQPGALPDSDIASLHVDAGGRLWIGTHNGLARYDAALERFLSFPAGPGGLSHVRVAALADDGRGGIWAGTGAGLEHIRADGRVFPAASGAPRLTFPGGVQALLRDRSGGLWIGTETGLYHRAADAQAVASALGQASIGALHQDKEGRIWIGARSGGVWVIERAGAAPRALGGISERVLSLAEKGPGVMWIGAAGGIIELDVRSGGTRRIGEQLAAAMLRERGGQVFVATAAGLSQHDPRAQGVIAVRAAAGKAGVSSLLARPNGQAWLGMSGGAVDVVDPRSGRIARLDAGANALPRRPILAIADTPDGAVYIGTPQGLYRSAQDGGGLRKIPVPGRADAPVTAVAWHKDVLWLGGPDGVRAMSMGAAPAVLRMESASLGDSRVSAILAAPDGAVWVGTAAGVARLDPVGNAVERLPADSADTTRLPRAAVASMLMDRKGRLWVAHGSSGVSVLERTDAARRRWFKRLDAADGLPEGQVNVLVADRRGHIWIGTDEGLTSIDPATDRVRRFSAADGIPVQAYTSGSAAHGDGGEILFGGPDGLTVVQPERLQRKAVLPAIAVTRLAVAQRALPAAPFNGPAKSRAALTVAAEDQRRGFTLDFAALDFAPPHGTRLAYRLQGFDADWVSADSGAGRATYTGLAPGRYTLQLRATSGGGDPAVHSLAVEVLPAWHQHAWLRALAVAAVLALAALLVRARILALRREQAALQDRLDARAIELQALRNEMERITYSDALTGLANRRCLVEEMQRLAALADDGGERFTLLLVDLEGFGGLNASLGPEGGDAVLAEVARRLTRTMRDCDFVARVGDDEFAVLMPLALSKDIVERICTRIGNALGKPLEVGETTLQVSASMGAATYVPGKEALARLRRSADAALQESKAARRTAGELGQAA